MVRQDKLSLRDFFLLVGIVCAGFGVGKWLGGLSGLPFILIGSLALIGGLAEGRREAMTGGLVALILLVIGWLFLPGLA